MFVYSLRANTLKFFGIIGVALVALVVLIVMVPSYEPIMAASPSTDVYNFDKIKTNDDRITFLRQFGWTVDTEPLESAEITIPAEFDRVFAGYNEIQKRQGLDLSKFKKKKMMRYTYAVSNYPGYSGVVYANVLVYRNKVVGGDICSANTDGFLHGFAK